MNDNLEISNGKKRLNFLSIREGKFLTTELL